MSESGSNALLSFLVLLPTDPPCRTSTDAKLWLFTELLMMMMSSFFACTPYEVDFSLYL
jgi:hypothetical protein